MKCWYRYQQDSTSVYWISTFLLNFCDLVTKFFFVILYLYYAHFSYAYAFANVSALNSCTHESIE